MVVVRNPFMSFSAHGTFGKVITVRRQYGRHIITKYPDYKYICTPAQLKERDRWRRLNIIANWYKETGLIERIKEVRPELILDPSGPEYYFDLSCVDPGFGNIGIGVGLVGDITKYDLWVWHQEELNPSITKCLYK